MNRFSEKPGPAGVQQFSFTLDGIPVSALPGDTVASALYAAGIRAWRRARPGDERGLLCGIGLCFDCLLTVDGTINLRACQVPARPGMKVETNLARKPAP
jgi:predicted molibdopterin-dependent oxidoreductase YjgC